MRHTYDRRDGIAALLHEVSGAKASTCDAIADSYPGGVGLRTARPDDLQALGATARQARRICAAAQLAAFTAEDRCGAGARDPFEVAQYVRGTIGDAEQEIFVVLYLDARQRVLAMREIGRGSLSHVDVHPRELFRDAIRRRTHAVILAHNHPSGDPTPSDADVRLTNRMCDAGRLLGIPVLDHVVVTATAHRSMAAEGLVSHA